MVDSCFYILDPQEKPVIEKLELLKNLFSKDGIHFTKIGYQNFAKNISNEILRMQSNMDTSGSSGSIPNPSAAVPVAGATPRHFWRGFVSPVGSKKHHIGVPWQRGHVKPHNAYSPYNRSNRGGRRF